MLSGSNTAPFGSLQRIITGLLAGVIVVGLVGTLRAQGQEPPALQAPLMDVSHAMRMQRRIETWLAAGRVPDEVEPVYVSDLSGMCVTLRREGRTVGVGQWTRDNAPARFAADRIDLAAATAAATRLALNQLTGKLPELGQPADVHAVIAALASKLTVDVQLAGELTPIRLGPGNDVQQLLAQFVPGYHGLRLTPPGSGAPAPGSGAPGSGAWTWPGNALAGNFASERQLVQMLSALGLDYRDVNKISRPNGPVLSRFEVIHVNRARPDLPVTQLQRGQRILPAQSIDARTADVMAHRLTMHLLGRLQLDGRLAGTYFPASTRYQPAFASDQQVALAGLVVSRHAALIRQAGQADKVDPLDDFVVRTTNALLPSLLEQADQNDPATLAMVLMTLCESPPLASQTSTRDALINLLLGWRIDNHWQLTREGKTLAMSPVAQAVVACALARTAKLTRRADLRQLMNQTLRELFALPEENQSTEMLSWIMRAVHDGPGLDTELQPPYQKIIARQLDRLAAWQITKPLSMGPGDTVGGFTFGDNANEPDWHSTQGLSVISQAIAQPGLVSHDDLVDRLLQAGLAGRFVAQLMFDTPGCYYVPQLGEARYGVRVSMIDHTLAVTPTAWALLAVSDLQSAARAFAKTIDEP